MQVFLNGKYVNARNAWVHADNRSFRYGDGFFETIKVMDGSIPLWPWHAQRLRRTLAALAFDAPGYFTDDYLQQIVTELVQRNGHTALARVRLTVYAGEGGLYDPVHRQPHLLVQSWPLNPESNERNSNGLVLDYGTRGIKAADALANLKSNNYLLYAMAALEAKEKRLNDAIVLNHRGAVADTTIANLWAVQGNTLLTPPLSDGPVAGTMRAWLLENLPAAGFAVREESLLPKDLEKATEVFLTNAIYGLKWVQQIGDTVYAPGPVAAAVHASLVKRLWTKTK